MTSVGRIHQVINNHHCWLVNVRDGLVDAIVSAATRAVTFVVIVVVDVFAAVALAKRGAGALARQVTTVALNVVLEVSVRVVVVRALSLV